MKKTAIVTDSNSGITQDEALKSGIYVIPMPFFINGELYFENINLTQDEFYKKLNENADISTSQPSPGDIIDLWNKLLKEYDEIVHIPMSSGLSSCYDTAVMLARDYYDRVFIVNNQRISVPLKRSVLEAAELSERGCSGTDIKRILEDSRYDSGIYIAPETLNHLKKGGRITPAAAAFGSLLNIKPVLQIHGGKLDAYAKARGQKAARKIMLNAIDRDLNCQFREAYESGSIYLYAAYTCDRTAAEEWADEIRTLYPDIELMMDPLSLSIACHIGPGAVGIAFSIKLKELR